MKKIPIIFVGGLLGNSLYRNDTRSYIWKNNLSFYLNSKNKRDASFFYDRENDYYTSNISVQKFDIIPGVWSKSVGSYILSEIEEIYSEKFSNLPDSNLKFFYYDWRRSVAEIAEQLRLFLPQEEFIIICQSNGCLLAQFLYYFYRDKFNAKAVFYISPPFWGSFETLRIMKKGFSISKGLNLFTNSESQSFPVSWELLPYSKAPYLNNLSFWKNLKWFKLNDIFINDDILLKTINKSRELQKHLNPKSILDSDIPFYIYGSNYGKFLNSLHYDGKDIHFESKYNKYSVGDSHTSLEDLKSITKYSTYDPEYLNSKGFLFINKSSENHRHLIASKSIRKSIINNIVDVCK